MSPILENGQIIATRYNILNYLDAGGMQEVYIAYDTILNKNVALKTPKNHSAEKRFRRSAKMSAKVNHPNVAKVLDYYETDDMFFLIEEYIDGKNLQVLLDNHFDFFDPHLILQFAHQMAKGIAASHIENIIHRDLKPSNIMVIKHDNFFVFKITDFGIAKLFIHEMEQVKSDDFSSLSASQTIMGAIPYMSPELISGPQYADLKSDVWAIGAMMYRLLTGDYIFGSGLPAVERIRKEPLKIRLPRYFQKKQFKDLCDKIIVIIELCCSKEIETRPSAGDLVDIIGDICYGCFERNESFIREYKTGVGRNGWIVQDIFFHYDSFYGSEEMIEVDRPVLYSLHNRGNRAHPVLPLKNIGVL